MPTDLTRWVDPRWLQAAGLGPARDQVVHRLRQRDARRAHADYAAAVARRERARRRPRRQLWARLTTAAGLAAVSVPAVGAAEPLLWAGAGAAAWAAATLPRRSRADGVPTDVPVLPPPLLPVDCPADPLVHRAYASARALRGFAASAPVAARGVVSSACREAEESLPELYGLGERVAGVQAVRARTVDRTAAASLDRATGALLARLDGAVVAAERLCSAAAGTLAAEAEHWSFEVDRLQAATRDLAAVADGLRETAAAEERAGLR